MIPITARGSTLIEILIVTLIVATVLTAIAGLVTQSLKRSSENGQKTLATSLAQEGLEVFRQYRSELGWDSFQGTLPTGTYCLNTLPATVQEFDALPAAECAGDVIVGTVFTREAEVTSSSTQVDVVLTVTWGTTELERTMINQSFKNITKYYGPSPSAVPPPSPSPSPSPTMTCLEACQGDGYPGATCQASALACFQSGGTVYSGETTDCATTCCCTGEQGNPQI